MAKKRSAAQIAAAKRNLAKARSKSRTAKQKAASKANIKKAQEANKNKPRTAAQKAAAKKNLEKARAKRKIVRRTPEFKHKDPFLSTSVLRKKFKRPKSFRIENISFAARARFKRKD